MEATAAARTPSVCDAWGLVLTSLDGVGPEAAAGVAAAAPTPGALVALLRASPVVAGADHVVAGAIRVLAGLPLLSTGRRVGPAAAGAIVRGLFGAGGEGLAV